MSHRKPTVASVLLGVWSAGCAAITASRTDTLHVYSSPPGAEIRVNGTVAGRTPASIQVTRKAPETVEVVASGYDPQRCPVSMTAGGGYVAGDVLLCVLLFPIGCISWIDAGGDWNTLVSPHCSVTLHPAPAAAQVVAQPPVATPPRQSETPGAVPADPASPAPPGNAWPVPEQMLFIRRCVEAHFDAMKDAARDFCSCTLDGMQARYPNTSIGLTDQHALQFKAVCAQRLGVPQSALRE